MLVQPKHPLFVAEVHGVNLRSLTHKQQAQIKAAIDRYAVLVFHEQELDDEAQLSFTRGLGPLDINIGGIVRKEKRRLRPEFADISNLDEHSKILIDDDRRRAFSRADRLWHTDCSFRHVPAKYSVLYARIVPPEGGETEFADLRAAYDELSPALKTEVEGLIAEHSLFHSRAQVGFTTFSDEERAALPPARQLICRTHPDSGRKTLYLASHAERVVGWPIERGQQLLSELVAFATQSRFVHQHRWRANDVVIGTIAARCIEVCPGTTERMHARCAAAPYRTMATPWKSSCGVRREHLRRRARRVEPGRK